MRVSVAAMMVYLWEQRNDGRKSTVKAQLSAVPNDFSIALALRHLQGTIRIDI